MASESIKVFCRVKPVIDNSTVVEYEVKKGNMKKSGNIEFFIPPELAIRHSKNMGSSYKFAFNQVFDQPTKQQDIYEAVAKPIVENALEGFNGTVFVYGQTATGKTYTIMGEENESISGNKPKLHSRQKKKQYRSGKPKSRQTSHHLPSSKEKLLQPVSSNGLEKYKDQTDLYNEQELHVITEEQQEDIDVDEYQQNNLEAKSRTPTIETEHRTPELEREISPSSGIIIRTLSEIFSYLEKYSYETELKVSYHEIYKQTGYDLLNGKRGIRTTIHDVSELPRVVAMTDAKRKLHLKNMSYHKIKNGEDAIELLHFGNANRQVAETHLNDASSRSHCIFTIHIMSKHPESETILRSKIHLVDLAGSERIGKSHESDKKLLAEGRNINLSLHHLQQVIVALSKKKASIQHHRHYHIPYRNSAMTQVLSDSLGGNSYTSMIVTISVDLKNLEESISTCRFAQQVATIDNKVEINQTEDPDLVIARLKNELEAVREQLAQATTSSLDSRILSDQDFHLLENIVKKYLEDQREDAVLDVGSDRTKISYCFKKLKEKYLEQLKETKPLQTEQETQTTQSSLENYSLSDEDLLLVEKMIQTYLTDGNDDAALDVGLDYKKINYCFEKLKEIYLQTLKEIDRIKAEQRKPKKKSKICLIL